MLVVPDSDFDLEYLHRLDQVPQLAMARPAEGGRLPQGSPVEWLDRVDGGDTTSCQSRDFLQRSHSPTQEGKEKTERRERAQGILVRRRNGQGMGANMPDFELT